MCAMQKYLSFVWRPSAKINYDNSGNLENKTINAELKRDAVPVFKLGQKNILLTKMLRISNEFVENSLLGFFLDRWIIQKDFDVILVFEWIRVFSNGWINKKKTFASISKFILIAS